MRAASPREAVMHAATETGFAEALTDRRRPLPGGLVATPARFAVYRNNVRAALVGALETRFPVSVRIVGEEFFRAMAAAFVEALPPRSPVLINYGDALPSFVEAFEPAEAVPYLPDVMRLEIARSEAYHAADAEPAGCDLLAALDPGGVASLRVAPHPAVRLLASPYPIATIAAMNAPGVEPRPIEDWSGEDVLVTRPRLAVLTHALPGGAHVFLSILLAGGTIGDAAAQAVSLAPAFDLAAALAGLVTSGAIVRFHNGADQ
jgi:hypothetical protein